MLNFHPITIWEFIGMLNNCMPPVGWPKKLAVANSGGPDSTCLLFLLNSVLSGPKSTSLDPGCSFTSLVSISVNHQLQKCSSDMSNHAARIAASLGTEHLTVEIPWSIFPYVPKPDAGAPVESVARDARYSVLFETMNSVNAEALAVGHHADDQVETVLMRVAKGTSIFGLGGMKSVRRFGMGGVPDGKMGWFGHVGMNRWIVRPFLGVSKNRILATCEANNLEYVTDATNFQPQLTLRNTIRHILSQKQVSSEHDIPFRNDLNTMSANLKSFGITLDLSEGPEPFRALVSRYAKTVAEIQNQAQEHLISCIFPSPPSSIVLSSDELSRVTDTTIRLAMVIDVLRYVSPYPWGSYQAEAFRNSSSLNLIISKLWSDRWTKMRPFSAGAGVLWTPVLVNSQGINRMIGSSASNGSRGWLASRLPPYRNSGAADDVHLDLTPNYRQAIVEPAATHPEQILYDCRFLLTIDWAKLPEKISQHLLHSDMGHRLLIVPHARYYLPRIILRTSTKDEPDIVLGKPCYSDSRAHDNLSNKGEFKGASWAHWEFIRRFSAY